MFLLLALLLFIVLPSPWNVVGGLASLVLGVLEVTYWQRRMRRQKVQTGVEQLVGATGEAAERLDPSGHVRILGELWEARSSTELPPGARVRVVAVDGLTLEVEPVDEAAAPPGLRRPRAGEATRGVNHTVGVMSRAEWLRDAVRNSWRRRPRR